MLLKNTESYKTLKSAIRKELFWEIGNYHATITANFADKDTVFTIKTSVSESQYSQFLLGIEELCVYQLKNLYGMQGNYQSVLLDIKENK